MKKETHVLKLPTRTVVCEITFHHDLIVFNVRFSRYGKLGDLNQVTDWLEALDQRYANDPRPTKIVNAVDPFTGAKAVFPDS